MANLLKKNYLELPAIKVNQPLGEFYIISISAKELLNITFSEPLRHIDSEGNVIGSQRPKKDKRLKEIATYIESAEMAFPNSIILAANYSQNGNIVKDLDERWRIEENLIDKSLKLIIPKATKLASIIDGQHRLSAFEFVKKEERFSDLQLVCSIYFDLPNSYQAFLFATINSNQKKVDRSLALEQFGYNVDDEPEKAWTPEKFAVFLSRKLNIDTINSPFYQHIKVTPLNSELLFPAGEETTWVVSTATIVDGICSLISTNPVRDRIIMQQKKSFFTGRTRDLITDIKDPSPLRSFYISNMDKTIYDVITNYFSVFKSIYWDNSQKNSYITKTVGVQAAFDILKLILNKERSNTPENIDFTSYIKKAGDLDFSDKFFQASGIGRGRIKNTLAIQMGLINKDKLKKNDIPFYEEIINKKSTNTQDLKQLWEDEAENTVANLLENAEWNFTNKTVGLYSNEADETPIIFDTLESFIAKLEELALFTFESYLPDDPDFSQNQKENFDVIDLVRSSLVDYKENLKQLGWIS